MKTFIIVAETALIAFICGAAWELNYLQNNEDKRDYYFGKRTDKTPV